MKRWHRGIAHCFVHAIETSYTQTMTPLIACLRYLPCIFTEAYSLCAITMYFQYKHAVYVQTCKLFADLERLRQRQEAQEMHEKYAIPIICSFIALDFYPTGYCFCPWCRGGGGLPGLYLRNLAVVALNFKILSGLYLGNRKV